MATVGYARVSSVGQSLDVQLEKLSGCHTIFQEKISGTSTDRPELKRCLNYLQEGDTLLVTKLDRLARSTADLYEIIAQLDRQGVSFRVVDDPTINTESRTGKLVMGILALIAEFEMDIRRERQMEGIARAKSEGRRLGPKPKLTSEQVEAVRARLANGETPAAIARDYGIHRTTVYRYGENERGDGGAEGTA